MTKFTCVEAKSKSTLWIFVGWLLDPSPIAYCSPSSPMHRLSCCRSSRPVLPTHVLYVATTIMGHVPKISSYWKIRR
ncbi:hypothetical protein BDB00DRAFT_822718 [Zychaea mexicana]|uniref:uncharacterized protein n=1 Tax=Zychaea mexicana TaxID=64656 RepID=UPI0022FDD21C|nr:uncharacterized protein BDB00DRAFT_822718 [Zychaea mexicana]KAI9493600.1 hypothetical protein BDB00DRAFT_822718 [Zychaea mexicana]